MIELVPIDEVDQVAVEHLLDRAFGRDRHGRTAYALRAGTRPLAGMSLAAVEDDILVGTIQCWPVWFVPDMPVEPRVSMVLVGPVAVTPERQQDGIGRRLMQAALDAVDPDAALMLIGDPEYYARFFGFSAERTSGWRLPGPVERHRLLARGTHVPAGVGAVLPRVSVDA